MYRYKRRYFVKRIYHDAYLSGEGLNVLHEIPHGVSNEEFKEWVRLTIETLEAKFEKLDSDPYKNEYVSEELPESEYTYQIDLDHLVFLIDDTPMFHLDNMPPDDVFLTCISYDHLGNRALREHTPIQFRYKWRAPPPPPRPEALLVYRSCPNRSSTSSIHELLGTPVALSSIERARTAFVGPLVTRFMIEDHIARRLRELEKVPDPYHMSKGTQKLALTFVNFAVGPPNPSLPCNTSSMTWDFVWIREDVCLRITTHLDDEQSPGLYRLLNSSYQ